jgi:hypothetical protein
VVREVGADMLAWLDFDGDDQVPRAPGGIG